MRKKLKKRADGRYAMNVTVGHNPDGSPIRRTVYGLSPAEVAQKAQLMRSEVTQGIYIEPAKMNVSDWADEYLRDHCRNLKPQALLSVQSHIKNHIKPGIGYIKLTDLSPIDIHRFISSLQDKYADKKKTKKLSAKTVRNVHGTLHKMLETAVDMKILRENPASDTQLPKVAKPDLETLEPDSVSMFFTAAAADRYYPVFVAAVYTGLRLGELLGTPWANVDLEAGSLKVRRTLMGKFKDGDPEEMIFNPTPKNWKARTVPLPDALIPILREHRLAQNTNRMLLGPEWQNKYDLMFTEEDGRPIHQQTIYRHFKKIAKGIGLKDLRIHDLRHTYAVLGFEAGMNPKTIQETLGHHSAGYTLSTYSFATTKMMKQDVKKLENYIAKSEAGALCSQKCSQT